MKKEEEHLRTLNLNAHFAWALAMWGAADVAREGNNYLLAPIGYYYSAFHSGFALASADHTIQMESFKRVGHSQLESWLPFELTCDFNFLRDVREIINYLGADEPQTKARIVRGHGFGFEFGPTPMSFFESVAEARNRSLRFIHRTLDRIEAFCKEHNWPGPRRGDDSWQMEYLDDDILLNVIPRDRQGPDILRRAFSVLEMKIDYEASVG